MIGGGVPLPILELTDAQVVELVKQLPPERQRAALLALAAGAEQRRQDRMQLMRDVSNRRFRLADALIIVAATAIGRGGCIAHQEIYRESGALRIPTTIWEYVRATSFQLVGWSWAIVIMRLIPPR